LNFDFESAIRDASRLPGPWARSPWRSASASVDRGGRCWCRAECGRQPAVVRGFPGAVRDRPGENGVDVPDQVRGAGGGPMPYGSLVKGSPTTLAYGSCAASPASTASSPVMASAWPCWNFTRQPVCVAAVTTFTYGKVFSLSRLVDPAGAHTRWPPR